MAAFPTKISPDFVFVALVLVFLTATTELSTQRFVARLMSLATPLPHPLAIFKSHSKMGAGPAQLLLLIPPQMATSSSILP
ncbi:hypothetical protein BVRB_8g189760 [Beta vulgaris subsp. vulgaris]|nr:hypothetical protein BVRB_8g189760 [Beta vulgaris subsp. vulgaris]